MQFAWDPVESALEITWSGVTFAISAQLLVIGIVLVVIALATFAWCWMSPDVNRED